MSLLAVLALTSSASGDSRRVITAHGVEVAAPAGWARVAPAGDGPVTDPRTLLVVGTSGVTPNRTQCQIAAYRVPASGAVVVIVGWKTSTSGGARMRPGRWPLKALTSVRRPSFECFAGRGAAASLALAGRAYQVNVMVGDRATRQTTEQALAVGRSFDLTGAAPDSAPPRMERTPSYVLGYCRSSARLRPVCPRLLPHMNGVEPHWETSICRVGRPGCLGLTWDDLELVDAGNGDRPPVWSHISFFAGNLTSAFPFRYPAHGTPPATFDGLLRKPHPNPVFLGTFDWHNKHGTLILAPGYPVGGEQGNHIIFRWRQTTISYALGLHAWEPLARAVATLKAVVAST